MTIDAVLVDDLGAGSLGIMVLALAFEEIFDIAISDDERARVRTVGEAVR